MPARARTALAALLALLVALGAAGCGLGAGAGTGDVTLTVTEDFGAVRLGTVSEARVPGSETVMRLLERHFRVSTRYGGGFVQSIDGVAGGGGRDWFYYVNGIQASAGAATTAVHQGDAIWWDFHDWKAAESIPAVVGAYPEPFRNGIGGRRFPVTLECASGTNTACARVSSELARSGVRAATQFFGTGSGTDSLNVLVAPWSVLREALVADLVQTGPSASGVYARFAGPGDRELELLDPRGDVVRTLGAGAGLLAATADSSGTPTWFITGTDTAGMNAAAAALAPARLTGHFAIAVEGGTELSLPLRPAR